MAWASGRLETSLGIAVRARDFELDMWRGVLNVRELELAVPGKESQPFLAASSVRLTFNVGRIFRGGVSIRDLRVDRPRLALGAPLPSLAESPHRKAYVEIRSFEILGGEIELPAARTFANARIGPARLSGLNGNGSFTDGRAEVDVSHGVFHVETNGKALDGDVRGSFAVAADGTFEMPALTAHCQGICLAARGHGSVSPKVLFTASYELQGDAARVFPDLATRGSLAASGDVEFGHGGHADLKASARVEAHGLAADSLASRIAFELPPTLALVGTELDVAGEIHLDLTSLTTGSDLPVDAVQGAVSAVWRRASAPLATASARSIPGTPGAAEVTDWSFDAALFPESDGERRAEGTLRLRSWHDLAGAELLDTRGEVREPNLDALFGRLGLRARGRANRWSRGEIEASVTAAGPLEAPRLTFEASWDKDGTRLVALTGRSASEWAGWRRGGIALDFDASLLPDTSGTREVRGRLVGLSLSDTTFRIDVPDLAVALSELGRHAGIHAPPSGPLQAFLTGRVEARGGLSGPLTGPRVDLDAIWRPATGGTVRLAGCGTLTNRPPFVQLERAAALQVRDLDLSPLGVPGLAIIRLEAVSDGTSVEAGTIRAAVPCLQEGCAAGELRGRGGFDLVWPPSRAEAEFQIEHPVTGVERASARLRLQDGVLLIESLEADHGASRAVARGTIPLGGVARHAGPYADTFASYGSGPVHVEVEGLDLHALLPLLPEVVPDLSGVLDAKVTLDPDDLLRSSGSLVVRDFSFYLGGRGFETVEPIGIELSLGRAEMPSTSLRPIDPEAPAGLTAELSGSLYLDGDWSVDQGVTSVIRDFAFDFHGEIEAAALASFVPGGIGDGSLRADAEVRGPPGDVRADVRVSGPDARISWYAPYATRLASPEVRLKVRDGTAVIESARARWNEGTLEVEGEASTSGDAVVRARFDEVAYRLGWGFGARIGGDLDLVLPADGQRVLRGELVVERASLRRNVSLDRELLRAVVEPQVLTDHPLFDTVHLNIALTTDQGLEIKNNLADLRADWERLEVAGTLGAPTVTGRVRVRPGGLMNVLGNILRIDEGTLSWFGDPPGSPRIALSTTNSLDDPTIKTRWYNTWYEAPIRGPGKGGAMDLTATRASSEAVMEAVSAGVMTYYRDQLVGAVGRGPTRTTFSYQPLPLLGETDTAARLTITQQLSSNATFIASNDTTEAEAQTYILDLQGPGIAPNLRAQLFTNDQKHEGVTLQQTVRFGAGAGAADVERRLRKIRFETPDGISKRHLRHAVSYRAGETLPESARLDVEFDVADALRHAGYPLAEAEVIEAPAARTGIDLVVRIIPGPRIRSEFEGDRPRAAARRLIAALYRDGDAEAASLEEIRQQTVLALQDRGFLSPQVEVSVERHGETGEQEPPTLRVRAAGGRKIDPHPPQFVGVSAEEASALAATFPTRLSRINLAAGTRAADRSVARTLAAAGYPNARVVSRELSEDGRDLVVLVETGGRQRLARVELEGLGPEEEKRLAPLLQVREGDPARADLIARSIAAIEQDLRRAGRAAASVTARFNPISPESPLDLALTFQVAAGPVFTVEDVRFSGLRSADPDWVRDLADLAPGDVGDPDEISSARTRLARTGVFEEVEVSTEPEMGAASRKATATTSEVPSKVLFELRERPRWQLSYGGRYETDQGFGAVVDLYNFNSLGRGHTSGVRTTYGESERRLRLYHVIPSMFGGGSSLEAAAEWKKELVEGVETKGVESWLQIGLPLKRRWQARAYVVVRERTLTAEDADPDTPLDQRTISPRLGWQIAYDSRVLPPGGGARQRGFFYGLNLIGATKALGSDLSGLATFQQWSHFLPLGDADRGRFTWAHSYRVSTINTRDAPVPLDDRLRAGGEFSVRGYGTNSLGPLDDTGDSLGGEVLFVANEELHARLGSTFYGLLFLDAGNVWPTLDDVDDHLFKSWGLGLRWSSPVGPLRLDYARPLDRRPGEANYRVYLGFGNVF